MRYLILICWLLPSSLLAAPDFSGQRALELIAAQVELGPRSNPTSRAAALQLYRKQLTAAESLREHHFQWQWRQLPIRHGTNLLASFGPQESDVEHWLLAAHWDTRPIADREKSSQQANQPISGANDGGSGVAVLLHLAEIMAQHPPPVRVDIALFDYEDLGGIDGQPFSIGANQFVTEHPDYRPDGGILLDMVCDSELRIPRELYSKRYAGKLQNRLWGVAKELQLSVVEEHDGAAISDDHLPFLRAGIPMVNLIHWPFPDSWHTHKDTLERCSSNNLAEVGRWITAVIYKADQPAAR
ncbi:M28 family peptidase [Porticoccaceae bacterium]|nr:M28 family peptidase [Porticoccaceae bacterium]